MAQAKSIFQKPKDEAVETPQEEIKDIQVVATMNGYHGGRRRFAGDVFVIKSNLFSEKWMEKVVAESK
jgi:hypothetical protein